MERRIGPPIVAGSASPTPHFTPQRPDHSPPAALSDAELARAIASLRRKLSSARRMLMLASAARLVVYAAIGVGGVALLTLGPAPIVEYFAKSRTLVTPWDGVVWWFGIVGAAILLGAIMAQVAKRRRRRIAGWRHRVDDLRRRLDEALTVQRERHAGG